jgi:hypothetical protein
MGYEFIFDEKVKRFKYGESNATSQLQLVLAPKCIPQLRIFDSSSDQSYIICFDQWEQFLKFREAIDDLHFRLEYIYRK